MSASESTASSALPLREDIRSSIEAGWRGARRAHGDLSLPLETFLRDVVALVRRARERLELPFDEAVLRAEVAGLHMEDLYLARLCEQGDGRAWSALVRRYEPDLRSVLMRDWSAAEAESVAADVLSEISLAPPSGGARTRVGTYDGSGPLWAWLATIGVRTARSRWRKRREVELKSDHERAVSASTATVEMDDDVARFVRALHAGWAQLETPERLALGWKHRDGLSQRVIARLLGVSEPTASRLVTRGTAKLKGHFAGSNDRVPSSDAALWTRLERALTTFLKRTDPPRPPEVE